jgi:hypothetical protein
VRGLARVLVFPAILIGAALSASPAVASCITLSRQEQAAAADVVVYGTVTETRQTFAAAGGVIRFLPQRLLKGTLPGEIQVYLGPTKGGAITSVDYEAVTRGQGHTLYLRAAGDGNWQTDACSGSHAGQPSFGEVAFFGAGTVVPPSPPTDYTALLIGGAAVVAIAIVAFVLALRGQSGGPSTLNTTSP